MNIRVSPSTSVDVDKPKPLSRYREQVTPARCIATKEVRRETVGSVRKRCKRPKSRVESGVGEAALLGAMFTAEVFREQLL